MNNWKKSEALADLGQAPGAENERTVTDLLVDQMEFADVIILNKTDLTDPRAIAEATALLHLFNPQAEMLTSQRGVVPLEQVLHTGRFSFDQASSHHCGLSVPRGEAEMDTQEYGIGHFLWQADQPFHPGRFWDFVTPDWPGLLRGQGWCFMADDPALAWTWSQTGPHGEANPVGHWPGAGKQELVFIGRNLDRSAMEQALGAALATPQERAAGRCRSNPFRAAVPEESPVSERSPGA